MKLSISINELADKSGYIARVDWSKGDAGQIGTPGCISYGDSKIEAYVSLGKKLLKKGHTIIK